MRKLIVLFVSACVACDARAQSFQANDNDTAAKVSPSELVAFTPSGNQNVVRAQCTDIPPRWACSQFKLPESMSFGVLICSCSGKDLPALKAATIDFSARFSLLVSQVRRVSTGWIVNTRDVKVLCDGSDGRNNIIATLKSTNFALSPEDRGSPYRVYVRRRDGKSPTPYDLEKFQSRGMKAEIETINVFHQEQELKR
jgi:hypothetical protein